MHESHVAVRTPGVLDESLLGVLQLHPRASWTRLAPILGVDASTLSRRWRQLRDAGLVWVSCLPSAAGDWFSFPPFGSTGLIEIATAPGEREAAAAVLCDDSRIWTIEATTGDRGLVLFGTFPTPRARDEFVDHDLARIPGITGAHVTPVRETLVSPGAWRTGTLPAPLHHAALELSRIDARPSVSRVPSRMDRFALRELARDGRRGAAEIARSIGASPAAISGAIPSGVFGSGIADFHVDFAAEQFGWDTIGTLLIQVPHTVLPELGATLWRYPAHVHTALSLFGEANIAVSIWTRAQWTIDIMEEMITTNFPQARVVNRWHTTRFYKRYGAILAPDGTRAGFVDIIPAPQEAGS